MFRAALRSESGRYDRHDERNVPRASRKDVRDAVRAVLPPETVADLQKQFVDLVKTQLKN